MLIGLAASLAGLLIHARIYAFLCDDAFISFRYARNLSHGFGLVFNPGMERVEGYSNFLWVVLLAALDRIGIAPDAAAPVLSMVATVALWVVVVGWSVRSSPRLGALALVPPLALAVFRTIAVWSTSGLETRMFELFAVAGAVRLVAEVHALGASVAPGAPSARPPRPLAAPLFALAALTRPDGLLIGGASLACAALVLVRRGTLDRRWLLGSLALWAGPIAAHFAFRLAYYGAWWPNTWYAKAAGRVAWGSGLRYLTAFVLEYGLWLWVPLIALGVRRLVRDGLGFTALIACAIVLPHALYVASIGGDHFEYRPFDLYVPFLALLLAEGLAALRVPRLAMAALLIVLAAFAIELPLASHRQHPDRHIAGFPGSVADQPAGATFLDPSRDPLYRWPGLSAIARLHRDLLRELSVQFVGIRQEEHRRFLDLVRPEGRALRARVTAGVLPHDTYVAIDCVGAIPYESDLRVLDRLGLTDEHVARSAAGPVHVLAHEKRATIEYAQERSVELWAHDRVHLLWPVDEPALLELAASSTPPFWVADAGEGSWIAADLPQGLERTALRFPRLRFMSSQDPAFTDAFLAQGIGVLERRGRERPEFETRVRLASYRVFANRAPEAIADLEALVRERPAAADAWYYLGAARLRVGDATGARTALERAVREARSSGQESLARQAEALLAP